MTPRGAAAGAGWAACATLASCTNACNLMRCSSVTLNPARFKAFCTRWRASSNPTSVLSLAPSIAVKAASIAAIVALDLVQACVLRVLGLKFLRVDGTIDPKVRDLKLSKFHQEGSRYFCMCLSTQVGGVGLTITGADRVILVDPAWNPAMDAQAIDRVHRIGQQQEVVVYRLIAKRGVGAQIQGVAGDCWGTVVDDEGDVWRLLSGRITKKQNEGLRWNWVDPKESTGLKSAVHSMIYCRTCLGSPYMIESNLLGPSAMHDMCWCKDPSDQLESVCQDWNVAQGHDSFYVKGMSGTQRQGLGVHNSEYIIFQPYQVLPLYVVDYIIE